MGERHEREDANGRMLLLLNECGVQMITTVLTSGMHGKASFWSRMVNLNRKIS